MKRCFATIYENMSEFARRRMRSKRPELKGALESRLTKSQRWVLGQLLRRYEELEAAIKRVEQQIDGEVKESAAAFVSEAVELPETIPGVGERVTETIASEIGGDMSRFPSAQHLSSWAGMCPGNNESGGKRRSGRRVRRRSGRRGSSHVR